MKLRILALHGYTQNAQVFREKSGALRKHLKNIADIVYVEAPHELRSSDPHATDMNHSGPIQRSWWRASDDGSVYEGVEESISYLEKVVEEEGPFDGAIGFSQGGAFCSLLAALQQEVKSTPGQNNGVVVQEGQPCRSYSLSFQFFISICGFLPRAKAMRFHFQDKTCAWDAPALVLFGTTDKIVPTHASQAIVKCFRNVEVIEFDGGHLVPSTKSCRDAVSHFLTPFLELKQSNEEKL
eukprot:Rmarinus@m.14395